MRLSQHKRRLLLFLSRLRWKLTLSYTLTTVFTLVIFEVIGILLIAQYIISRYPYTVLGNLRREAIPIIGYLTNPDALSTFLQNNDSGLQDAALNQRSGLSAYINVRPVFTIVVNPQGQVLAAIDNNLIVPGNKIQKQLSTSEAKILSIAATGKANVSNTMESGQEEAIIAAAPIMDKNQQVVGVILTKQIIPDLWMILIAILPLVLPSFILVTLLAGLVGTLFGTLLSMWLTRRFKKVGEVTAKWSKGDFTSFVNDESGDEIGQLGQRLNSMARQLEDLIHLRQSLAMLEERNRLARDLHDCLKQQIFAISMQVGSAQTLIDYDVAAAKERLTDVEHTIQQTQEELSTLIYQLHPSALADKPLAEALYTVCKKWSELQSIALHLSIEENLTIAVRIEEALFRIAQEALANIAHHSQATQVQVQLYSIDDEVVLRITDNGKGFDLRSPTNRGIGLLSMRERMEELSGYFQIKSKPREGTKVIASCKRVNITANSEGEMGEKAYGRAH